jgi:hypothetical protein
MLNLRAGSRVNIPMGIDADARAWIVGLGRLGYAAQGVVYLILGTLACRAAMQGHAETPDHHSAFEKLADGPFGKTMLSIVALGLAGYAVWRFIQTVRDTENKGSDLKGLTFRFGYFVSAITHFFLAVTAARMVDSSSTSHGATEESLTAQLMAQPFGRWLAGLIGLAVIGFALYQFYASYKAKFREHLNTHEMSATERTWAIRAGRWGLAAHAVTFLIIGGFLVHAAVKADPGKAQGLGDALQTLENQPFGPWLLLIVGAGLLLYGVFQLTQARYRRMVFR